MPKLPTPVSRPKLPQTVFTPDSQGAAVARADIELAGEIGRFGDAMTQRQSQSEISKLNAEFATAQAELTVAWQEQLATADPNDPTTAQNFRDTVVKPRLEALNNFANTREAKAYAQRAGAGLSAGFLTTTEAGQRGLRETAAVQNFNTMLNQMGDAVTADPLSFDSVLTMTDIQLEGLVQAEGLGREKALILETEAKSNLALGAAQGLIDRNPAAGRDIINSGKFSEFIDASQKQRLLDYADRQERAQAVADDKALKEAAAVAQVEIMKAAINEDGTVNAEVLPKLQGSLIRDPRLAKDPSSLRAMTNYLDALAEDAEGGSKFGKTDPSVHSKIMERAKLPPGDPRRPTRNEVLFLANNGLSTSDARFIADTVIGQEGSVREQLGNDFRASGLKAAAARLTGSSAIELAEDPGLVENYNRFLQFARLTEVSMLEEGKSPAEIWAADGPILGRVQEFNKRLSLQEQTQVFQQQLDASGPSAPAPQFEGDDPSAFDTGSSDQAGSPAIRTGPNLGAQFKGKSLKELTPAEMDAWLKENK